MESAKKLRAHKDAKEYVQKVGRREHHVQPSFGSLHMVSIETQVCYQASPGATNYWQTPAFDDALARVVRARFSELAEQAIALLWGDYTKARIAEKDALLAQLAEIEALEKAA